MSAKDIEDSYPLSPMQQAMLFQYRLDPGSGLYIQQVLGSLREQLNIPAFQKAWEQVLARHPVLRTSFRWEGTGEPMQYVHRQVGLPFEIQDWRDLSSSSQQSKLQEYLKIDRQRGFDLTKTPLMRLALFRMGDAEFQLVWTCHHIIVDGLSQHMILSEAFASYDASCQRRDAGLEHPRPYRDYIDWLQVKDPSGSEAFWRRLLKGFEAPTALNVVAEINGLPDGQGDHAQQEIRTEESTTSRLRMAAGQHNLTLNTLIQGAWALLLSRYTGEDDIVFGAARACRHTVEGAGSMVGLLMNNLPVRVRIRSDQDLLGWLKELREQHIAVREHEHTPLIQVMEWSDVGQGMPLFESAVAFDYASTDSRLREQGPDWQNRKFHLIENMGLPLVLHGYGEAKLVLRISYDTRRFSDATVGRMLEHLGTLLQSMAEDLGQPVAALPILTKTERYQLLEEWNDTQVDYPQHLCLHELFEAQVERTPDAIAVSFEGEDLTYRALNRRANQLAHHLQRLGVGPEVLVGVFMERSLELVVALYGILKAGGAYVPLDPEYPPDRIAFMLEDTQVPVVLTQQRLAARLPEYAARMICLDGDWDSMGRESAENPTSGAASNNLAYVIYTSGSTGRPKGVMNSHRGICNQLLFMQGTHQLTGADSVLQQISVSFDPSVVEVFWPLMVGARLVVARPEGHRDTAYLVRLIVSQAITTLFLVPSMLQLLVEEEGVEECRSLKRVFCGGEALPFGLQERFFELLGAELHNLYGPTEAAVTVTKWECQRNSDLRTVPIGRPVANTQLYILDPTMRPVPIGVAGELHIGGIQVARGYLNRPALTAERFIPDPFSDDPQARLYKTGDLTVYRPDGNIEFLGRVDIQVKMRGFRIELGEIETVLNQHPAVKEAVVLAREDVPGDKRLVAYVVLVAASEVRSGALRDFLHSALPAYMVPGTFVQLEALPLLPTGKVDRRALPAPAPTRPDLEPKFVAPRTPTEETLCGIWAEILGIHSVGIHDDFFDLGGHSLLATQCVARVRKAFRKELPMRCIFETPTIATLAEAITASQLNLDASAAADEVIPRRETSEPCPLSFAQQRLWFLDQLEPGTSAYNVRAGVRLRGPLNVAALERSLDEVVRRHEVLRTTFSVVDSQPVQIVAPTMTVPLSVASLMDLPESQREAESERLIAEEVQRPFDLARGPLLRATLLQLRVEENILLLTMHHIITDGWSIGVFFDELSVLYKAFLSGASSPLPESRIQYADYGLWQRQWLQGEVLEEQLSYWKQQLGDLRATFELPTDRSRPAVQTFHAAQQTLVLSEELSESLEVLSKRERVTLSMMLLAMFKVLLYRYTGQDDVVVGSPIAGRTRVETEGMLGFFVNTLVLRTDLSGNPSFRHLLERVREVTLGAYAHQDLPFEKLVEALDPERDLSRTPLFQVFFNVLNLGIRPLEMAGLTVERLSPVDIASKFDMTLYVADWNQRIQFDVLYNTDLFDHERMTEMLAQLEFLASQIVNKPEASIQTYSLVTPRSRLLLPDPAEVLPEPWHEPVTEHFARWLARDLDLCAIQGGGLSWTYAELANSAHALAQALRVHGVERGDVVAAVGPRSFGLIASMVGVLWSGGVLLNLDPNLPPRRQQLMLAEAGVRCLLYVGMRLQADEWMWESAPVIRVEPHSGCAIELADGVLPAEVPLPQITPNDPAYLFFTSGSTGVPKGVLGCHKGLAHFVNWQRQTFDIGPSDRSAQLTGLSFDVVLRDIFTPLTSGATLCLPAEEEALDPSRLLSWMERERISMLHTVPSLAEWWLQNVPPGVSLQALRWVFFAGEPLTERLVHKWRQAFPQSGEVVNLYGPTETTLAKCYFRVPSEPFPGVQPVGSPMPQTQALVLGENDRLCGVSEPGEIVVRTPFRSLGYINASEENQRRFVRNPFRNDEQDVIYYTGDRGRYRPDGLLDILGRVDHQVKLRGVRIELGGIETVLGEHPAVWQTVVLLREDIPGEKSLVAYVVGNNDHTLTAEELRRFARQRLPEPMVPSAFVLLSALPLMANGKVDRRALPQPDRNRLQQERMFVAPRTSVEEVMADIWTQVLDLQSVGVHDDFFDLGGHSLLAAQVIARIRDALRVDLPLRSLFDAPTIAGLAESVEALRWLAEGPLFHTVSGEMTREEGEL